MHGYGIILHVADAAARIKIVLASAESYFSKFFQKIIWQNEMNVVR